MKKPAQSALCYCLIILLCCPMILNSQTADSSSNMLEMQQRQIRNLVEQQKKMILSNSATIDSLANPSFELELNRSPDVDSMLNRQMKLYQEKEKASIALKKAIKENVPRKSNLRKTLVICGLCGGTVIGIIVYFLTRGDSNNGSGTTPPIDDKPPLHP